MTASTRRCHYGWIVLAGATLVVFGSLGLARFGYSAVCKPMQSSLMLDNTQTGGLATADLVGYLALAMLGGALASRFGPRLVISIGLVLVGGGMILTGYAQGFADAAACRFITGIGSGASNVPAMGLLAAWFVVRRRGLAMGIAVTGSSLGLMFVGLVVPRILSAYGESGWRTCWIVFGVITLLLAVMSYAVLRNRPSDVAALPVGSEADGASASPAAVADRPKWWHMLGRPVVWHVGVVYVAFGFSYVIYTTFFHKYLIAEGGYTTAGAGNLYTFMGFLSVSCGLIWGVLSDVIGRKWALACVYLMHTASFSLFALSETSTGYTASAVLFGLSAWSIPAIMAATCGDLLGSRLAPAGLGFITLFFGLGQAAGPAVAGAIADATTTGTLRPAMFLAAGVALLGAIGSSMLRVKPVPDSS